MGALSRLIFTLMLLAAAGGAGYYYGYHAATGRSPDLVRSVVGTGGSKSAGETGATIGRSLAQAGSEATGFLSDAALTTKIKSKIGLDDHLEGSSIHVSTSEGVVTLTGTVPTDAEHARAVALAHDTKGIKRVVDKLTVQ